MTSEQIAKLDLLANAMGTTPENALTIALDEAALELWGEAPWLNQPTNDR